MWNLQHAGDEAGALVFFLLKQKKVALRHFVFYFNFWKDEESRFPD